MATAGSEPSNSDVESMDVDQAISPMNVNPGDTGHLMEFKLQFDDKAPQKVEIHKNDIEKSLQSWCNKNKTPFEVKDVLYGPTDNYVQILFSTNKAAEFFKERKCLESMIKNKLVLFNVVERASASGKFQGPVEAITDMDIRILESQTQTNDLQDSEVKSSKSYENSDTATQDLYTGNASTLDPQKESLTFYNNEHRTKRNRTVNDEFEMMQETKKQDEMEMMANSDSEHFCIDYFQYDYFIKAYSDKVEEIMKKGKVHLSPKWVTFTVKPADGNADANSTEKAKQDLSTLIQSKVTNLKQEKVVFSMAQRKAIQKAFLDVQETFCRVILNVTEEGCTLTGPPEDVVFVKEELETALCKLGHRTSFRIKPEGSLCQNEINIDSLHWKFLKKIYERNLEEIQDHFGVKFIQQKHTQSGKQKIYLQLDSEEYNVRGHALQAFIELCQKTATNLIQRSVKNHADVVRAKEAHLKIENKQPDVDFQDKNGEFHFIGHHHHIALEIEKITKLTDVNLFKELPEIGKLEHLSSKEGYKPTMKDETGATNRNAEDETCPICLDSLKEAVTISCKHSFCKPCWEEAKAYNPVCPVCQTVLGIVKGNQPDGKMHISYSSLKLPGYACDTIEIHYLFPNGKQSIEHPKPGHPYYGARRTAYLPNNKEGREVLALLKRAFDQRLIFTIGTSRTTGSENVVTWNDIHHKTNRHGGPENYGYPDPTYLQRVKEELKAKGIL